MRESTLPDVLVHTTYTKQARKQHFVCNFSVLAMAYTLVIVKDSRKLREARIEREAAEALLLQHNEDNEKKVLVCTPC